jgi:hypothetical protein
VLLGIAMGTARVVAAGRNAASLDALVKAAGPRVAAVQLTGEVAADAAKLREACGGGAETRLLSTWSVERATPMPRSPHSRVSGAAADLF